MRNKIRVLVVLFVVSAVVQAHEFWLEPQKFFFQVGEKAVINFRVGENLNGEPWDLKRHRIEKLEVHQLENVTDQRSAVKENLELTLNSEGTHVIVIQSNNAFSELEGAKFNEYLKEDGLDDVYVQREKTKTLDKPGKEFYSRHSKLLIQVGSERDDTYKKVIGLPIEIIPDKNPYALKKGEVIRFKILWEGKPLFGARVKVWNRHNNRTIMQNIYSEQNGMIETHLSNTGSWMVSVVKMVPSKLEGAEWQSYWGSLVFGVQ